VKQHTRDELRQLIPFFVAGTLEGEERRAVEQAIGGDPSFKEDLLFWQSAAAAVHGQAAHTDADHPSSELLVHYAEGASVGDDGPIQALDEHVTTCTSCRDELGMIRASFESQARHRDRAPSRIRLWPRLAAAAAVLVVGAVLLTRWLDRETRPTYALMPTETTRSLDPDDVPVVEIETDVEAVEFRLSVPATDLPDLSYIVRFISPQAHEVPSSVDFVVVGQNSQTDQILVVLDAASAFPLGADYQFEVEEVIPAGVDLLPETYFYVFRVERED